MIDVFATLGDMLNPHQLPQHPKGKPGKPVVTAEDLYTWNCALCGCPCAGKKNDSRICKSCEDAAANLTSRDDDFEKLRDIEADMAEDRRQRDQDWRREYTYLSNH